MKYCIYRSKAIQKSRILVFILFILFPLVNSAKKVCVKTPSGDPAKTLCSMANFDADPCSDFNDYACGNFLKTAPKPPHMHNWNSFAWASDDVNHKLHELLVSDEKEVFGGRSKAVTGMKEYYRSCLKPPSSDLSPLIKVIRELGGWPLAGLEHPDLVWKSKTWNLQTGLNVAHLYQSFPLLLIRKGLVSNPRTTMISKPSINIIYATKDEKLASKAFQQAVLANLKSLKKWKGGKKIGNKVDKKVKKQIKKMWKLEKDLNKIKVKKNASPGLNKPTTYVKARALLGSFIKLNKIMKSYYKKNIRSTDKIIVNDLYYFQKLKKVLKGHSKKTIANYLVWRGISDITSDISNQFKSVNQTFHNLKKPKKTKASKFKDADTLTVKNPRWEKCLREIVNKFEFAIASSYVHRHINPSFKKEASKMCLRLVKTAKTKYPAFLDKPTKRKMIKKLKKIKCQMAYPSFILNVSKLDKYYNTYKGGSTYLQRSISHRLFKSHIASRGYGNNLRGQHWLASPVLLDAYIFHFRNKLILFAGILNAPLFYPGAPKEVKLGSLGVTIAHELTHAFLPPDSNGDGVEKEWWTGKTKKAYKGVEKCYVQTYDKLKMFKKTINGRQTLKVNIADSGGLWLAFHQLLKYYRDDRKNWKQVSKKTTLPGINLTRAQVFFVTYAQKLCSVYDKKHSQYMFNRPHTFNNIRLQGTLRNSKEFSRAFKCPSKSTLNPSKKCRIY